MRYLFGAQASLATLVALAGAHLSRPIDGPLSLRAAYLRYLAHVNPHTWLPEISSPTIEMNAARIASFDPLFQCGIPRSQRHRPGASVSAAVRAHAMDRVRASLQRIRAADAALYDVFRSTIHTLYYAPAPHAHGGSHREATGIVWCNHPPSWSVHDLIEFLVHQLTHHLMFLDEYRYGHVTAPHRLVDPAHYALCPFDAEPRQVHEALHGLVAACEILTMRSRGLVRSEYPRAYPATPVLLRRCATSLADVRRTHARAQLLAPRAVQILTRVEGCLRDVADGLNPAQDGKEAV